MPTQKDNRIKNYWKLSNIELKFKKYLYAIIPKYQNCNKLMIFII